MQFEEKAMSAGISKICEENGVLPERDAKFAPALKQAKKSVENFAGKKAKNRHIVPIVILLTDGNCSDRMDAIAEAESLKSHTKTYPTPTVFCIRFGSDNVLQDTVRFMSGKGYRGDILGEISSHEKMYRSATRVELNEMLLKFHSNMVQGTIGVMGQSLP